MADKSAREVYIDADSSRFIPGPNVMRRLLAKNHSKSEEQA
jgi:hypothetical protein